jgi:hypothetical protein
VLALDATEDPNKGEGTGYADDKNAPARRRDVFPNYLEQAYNMANDLHFFAHKPYKEFQEEYLKKLLLSLGGKDRVCLASLISQSAKVGLGFREVGAKTVLESDKKAVLDLKSCWDRTVNQSQDGNGLMYSKNFVGCCTKRISRREVKEAGRAKVKRKS